MNQIQVENQIEKVVMADNLKVRLMVRSTYSLKEWIKFIKSN